LNQDYIKLVTIIVTGKKLSHENKYLLYNMKQYVILVDSFSEIIEFDNKAEAQNLAGIFQSNSDSGYKYHIRKIV